MMNSGAQAKRELTRAEAGARAGLLGDPRYHVALDLTSGDESFGVTATVRFRCARPGSDTWIDFSAGEIERLELNGRPLDRQAFDGERIALTGLVAENTLVIAGRCPYSRNGIGLHRFRDPADGETYLYSDFEPREAHRVYPCFDQPDLKGTLTLDVTAPQGWEVIANAAPRLRPAPGAAGVWSFPTTPVMPTYVTAVIAGPYHAVRTRHGEIDLGIHCRRSIAADLDQDEIFTITRQGFDFFTALFARPYVFGKKYDQIFVPEFNSGAMENAGCVTFNESMIFRAKVTEADREDRALVILHELAHMWFGNLVTMRWWDDLWLNESFATYMGQLALARATRFQNGWTSFARSEKPWATTQDQLPTTHPIVADVPDTTAARTQFDGISYAKGASALKQLVAWVGEEAFTAGIRRYFTAHAYGNADLAAFLDALAAASGRDLHRWSRDWLEQAGVNTMAASYALADSASTHSTGADIRPGGDRPRIGRFTVEQSASSEQPTLRPHRIAIGIYDHAPGELRLRRRFEADVEGAETRIPDLEGEPEPDLILLNDQDLTYAKIRFDRRSRATIESSLATLGDPLARVLIWNAVWDEVRDAVTPASRYVDLVLGSIHGESDPGVMRSLFGNLGTAITYYRTPEDRATERQRVATAALAALEAAAPASDVQLIWAKAFVSTARLPEHLRRLRDWLQGANLVPGLAVDRELRWQITVALAALGALDEDEIGAELARERSDWSQRQAAGALAARPTPAAKAAAWTAIAETPETPLATMRAHMAGFMRSDQEAVIAPYVERYFAALRPLWASRDPELVIAFAGSMYPGILVQPELLALTSAELSKGDLAPPIRRRLLEQQDQVARALRAQAADRKGKEAAPCSAR